jgi:hypothetical protein
LALFMFTTEKENLIHRDKQARGTDDSILLDNEW